jgi:hypothetical protein
MTSSIATRKLSELSAVQAQSQLAQVFELVKKARTLAEIQRIKDGKLQMEAFFRTRQAAVAMGDQIESLRAKLRELTLRVELQQGEITARMNATERACALKEFGLSHTAATHCEIAAALPRKQVEALSVIQQRKGLELRAKDLVPIVELGTPERKLVASQLGEVRGIREAIERAKALPEWKPIARPETRKNIEIVGSAAPAFAGRCRALRSAVNTLVTYAERYAVDRTEVALARALAHQQMVVRMVTTLGNPNEAEATSESFGGTDATS